ncbi:MAG: Crp/Fnr family transcriptional regulator [Firmicutes bacterium]|nr:Crp/Fnr family transcriptional regulator [Bacillota bacterium]
MKSLNAPQDIPLFENITADDLKSILSCLNSYEKTYRKGEIIIMEQDSIKYAGLILSGTVHMMKEDIWGRQTLLAYMRESELIGELFAVQKSPYSYVSFIAATDVTVLFIEARNIIHSCPNQCIFHEQLTRNLFDLIGRKSIRLMEKIEITSKPTLREKIMAYLSLQAQKNDSMYITLPLGRTELASYIGANRSALTRELASMKKEGLIDYDRNTFRILK